MCASYHLCRFVNNAPNAHTQWLSEMLDNAITYMYMVFIELWYRGTPCHRPTTWFVIQQWMIVLHEWSLNILWGMHNRWCLCYHISTCFLHVHPAQVSMWPCDDISFSSILRILYRVSVDLCMHLSDIGQFWFSHFISDCIDFSYCDQYIHMSWYVTPLAGVTSHDSIIQQDPGLVYVVFSSAWFAVRHWHWWLITSVEVTLECKWCLL